ncbi:hypothetical protein [Pyrobaculum aerophilum]|uniref:hypothetical protein n=1 Tax=Pyrobaculum aerophilum TaxID=13773 RepID=UPI0015F24C23|nr:hypothetical protein [Pyrobaculum aerophilum]
MALQLKPPPLSSSAVLIRAAIFQAAGMFATAWAELSRLWRFGVENGLYADHILISWITLEGTWRITLTS